ncbi:MAG: hypothetical protein WB502_15270, partial [Thermoactinomyces sp.]
MKILLRWMVIFLLAVAGEGIFGNCTGYAELDSGSFEIPDVQRDFGEYEQPSQMQNNPPISPNAQAEEEGIWKKISGSLESAWNWAKEKVSDTWEWTKETASSA